jgi:hypothetical protein
MRSLSGVAMTLSVLRRLAFNSQGQIILECQYWLR